MWIDKVVLVTSVLAYVLLALIVFIEQWRNRRLSRQLDEALGSMDSMQEELQVDGGNRRLGSLVLARCGREMLKARNGASIGSDELCRTAAHLLRQAEEAEKTVRGAA